MADAAALIEFYNHLRATGLLDDLVDDIVAKGRETAPSRKEARLRLTCAALTGLSANPTCSGLVESFAAESVAAADACLALLCPKAHHDR